MGRYDFKNLAILARLDRLEKQMASVAQGYSDLQSAIAALSTEETSVLAAIQALQQQIAAGTPVTGDQLEALVNQVNGVTASLTSAIASTAPPQPGAGASPAAATATQKTGMAPGSGD